MTTEFSLSEEAKFYYRTRRFFIFIKPILLLFHSDLGAAITFDRRHAILSSPSRTQDILFINPSVAVCYIDLNISFRIEI